MRHSKSLISVRSRYCRLAIAVTVAVAWSAQGAYLTADSPADLVDPLIDTHNSRWFYFSSACRPFGMVNLSPDTQTNGSWKSGYLYGDNHIRCFSHVHAWQLSGIAVMPTTGPMQGHLGMDAYQSEFSHETEVVEPGYHKVVLDRYRITAELTSTVRVGFHRYSFPAEETGYVLFDTGAMLGHGPMVASRVEKVSDTEIAGWSLMEKTGRRPKDTYVYFVARCSKPFTAFGGWQQGKVLDDASSVEGADAGAYLEFDPAGPEPLLLKVGLSYTSIEGARRNLDAELPHWDFDRVRRESKDDWNRWLGRIQIEGGTRAERVKFYTDLWHALLGRRIISDADGSYCDMTGHGPIVRRKRLDAQGNPLFPHYNFDALWGSHWSLNILWSLAYPEVMDGTCETMVDMYRDGGLIPRGPSGGNYTYVMIGDPAASFFACAYNKGIRTYDVDVAYEGLRKNAFPGGIRDHAGYEHSPQATGGGMQYYVDLGYVPADIKGKGLHLDGASMTLEYAYQDWCLGQLAKALGKQEDYELFQSHSQNYRNLWDPEWKLIRPRLKNGDWLADFQPTAKGEAGEDFCESNSMIYTNYVPHDMAGLVELFGGESAYCTYLNHSFEQSAPRHFLAGRQHAGTLVDYENQPGTAMAHLFNYCGDAWLSQKWVREVKRETFGGITPYEGYNGDEDQGQMGALGVLMAIGLFEVDGGASIAPIYEITSPLFERIVIQLHPGYYAGKQFEIMTANNSSQRQYIQSAHLNGEPLDACWFPHKTLQVGGKLELTLGEKPNKQWGKSPPPETR